MTYCIGMLLEGGLVMMADTRTNAGVDNISSYRKLHVLADTADRLIVVLTSGNLSITQSALTLAADRMAEDDSADMPELASLFHVAKFLGGLLRTTREGMLRALEQAKVATAASMLIGGRVGGEPLRLFHIYGAGNFVECHAEQPYMQIGETKYGKPIIDRVLRHDTPIEEAVKVGLISFDSTIRSNLAVGPPIDLLAARNGGATVQRRIERDDGYFADMSARWSTLLSDAFDAIPAPPFLMDQPA